MIIRANTKDNREIILRCSNCNKSHIGFMSYWKDEPKDTFELSFALNIYFGFFRRCWEAIKYIFCNGKNLSHFDTILLDEDDLYDVRDFVNEYIRDCEKSDQEKGGDAIHDV